MSSFPKLTTAWIRSLAEPYLRGYRPKSQSTGPLRGYWFLRRRAKPPAGSSSQTGFFVGYLLEAQGWERVELPPACLVFAFVRPLRGQAHRRLVAPRHGLFRRTHEYIRWLTHRPPRFAFHEEELPALVRSSSMCHWPAGKWEHFSRNFFIETLALLVRSGLVRRLALQSTQR